MFTPDVPQQTHVHVMGGDHGALLASLGTMMVSHLQALLAEVLFSARGNEEEPHGAGSSGSTLLAMSHVDPDQCILSTEEETGSETLVPLCLKSSF